MPVDPLSVLHTAVFLAIVCALYGLAIGLPWAPFLAAARLRRLFEELPPDDWRASYVLWIPLPAALWGLLFGAGLSLSRDVRPPTQASELYVAGVDGIAVASLVSVPLWPILLAYGLPARGYDWDPDGYAAETLAILFAGSLWYHLFLVVPAYVLSVFAGFGDAMSGT